MIDLSQELFFIIAACSLLCLFFVFFFFFFLISNLGFPGSINFVGEVLILFGLVNYSFFFFFIVLLSFFLSVIYSIWLPNRIVFGNLVSFKNYYDLDERELLVVLSYFFLSLYLGIFPNFFLNYLVCFSFFFY